MAYIWDIPGWNSGAKVRRSCWRQTEYLLRQDDGTWDIPANGTESYILRSVLYSNDWELCGDKPVEVEVFEWMYPAVPGLWVIIDRIMSEAEAAEYFDEGEVYRKTGRSFKVPVTKKEK